MARIVQIIPMDAVGGGVETAARAMAEKPELACDFRLLPLAGDTPARDTSRIILPRAKRFTPRAYADALRKVLAERPDVLVCSLWRSVPVALAAKRLRPQMKLVLFIHSAVEVHVADSWLHRIAMRAADAIWADSHATLEARVPASLSHRTRVISFVLDRFPRARPLGAPPRADFVSWGRLHHVKGIDIAIRLVARLVARGIDARFDAWGPDIWGELPNLEALARELDVAHRVRFRGETRRDALPALAADKSFYLQLSRLEGMATAVVEGMQLGLVPVVTPVGEMKHYCRSGHNAVVVEVDALDAAADRLAAILRDAAEYRRLSENASAHWRDAPLYADDVCRAALELVARAPEQALPGEARASRSAGR